MAITASSVSLSAPYAIFPLSQPLHQTRAKEREGGTYRACFTSSVESTKKRKRGGASEIVVAVDGEGVNIYDVRSTQIVSTYALPPTTKFSCAPTSSFSRAAKKTSSFSRRTYAAVSVPKKQLLCWEEHGVSSSDDKAEAINFLSCNSESCQDIIYLQDLSAGRKRSAEGGLLAVYADGYIRCFSSDLESEKWEFTPSSVDAGERDYKVVYAAPASLAMAKKAIFRNRLDVVLPEPTAEEDIPEDTVLFTVSRRGSTFEARLFSIPASQENTPRELLVLTLPGSAPAEDDATGSSVFSVHFPTGTLNFLSAEKLTTYSLTSTVPSIISSLHLSSTSPEDPAPSSLLRISPSTVLVATNEYVSLYDTKFSSLQARVPIQPPSTTVSTPAASRSSTPASTSSSKVKGGVFLTAYLSELDLAIGYSQNGIVAVQISRGGSKDESRKSGLLIDSLCRGVDGLEMPAGNTVDGRRERKVGGAAVKKILNKLASEKARLATVITKLREARKEGDLQKFEGAFAEYVGVKRNVPQVAVSGEDTTMINGDITPQETSLEISKPLPEFTTKQPHKSLPHEFVTAVLALIFEPTTTVDGEQILTISFYPPNVIKHLAESGNLSSTLLPSRTSSNLVSTITTYDPTLRTLEWALSTITAISASEVISAIAAALVPAGPDDDLALKVIRSEVLRLALVRLDTFPASIIIASLKAGLSGEDLMTLIGLLRRELSVHDVNDFHHEDVGVGIGDMGIVASLLTAALDSVGIGGLVLVNSADEFITGLHEEVGDAVDAIEEAAGLKGILEEMFRHADWRRVAIERRNVEKNEKTVRETREKVERKKEKKEKKRLEVREKKADESAEKPTQQEVETPEDTAEVSSPKPDERNALAIIPPTTPARRRTDARKTPHTTRKARLARADPLSRAAHIARLQARRKPRTPRQKRHGQKGQGRTVSALLPLGLAPPPPSSLGIGLTLRGLVGTGMGADVEKREIERKWGREANYRESLVAGVYSVESMVV